jgi:hypothetical protein
VFPSGFSLNNAIRTKFTDCTCPCPRCGNVGHIPDGVFDFVGDSVKVISDANISTEVLQGLVNAINAYMTDPSASREQITEEIKRRAPGLSPLLAAFPHNRVEWYAFLGLLVAFLTLWVTWQVSHQPTPPTIEIFEQVISKCGHAPTPHTATHH